MGCDIHVCIDYDDFKTREGNWWVSSFATNIGFGRNYTLFTLMAGVRYDARTDNYKPLFAPRGIFERLSFSTLNEYTLRISDEGAENGWDKCVSSAQAQKWLTEGWSIKIGSDSISSPDWHSASWLNVEELKQIKKAYQEIKFFDSAWFQYNSPSKQPIPPNGTAQEMVNPFSGTPEWYVTVGEAKTYPVPETFNAIIAAMEALNEDNPERSRLVFWFDN